MVRVLDSWLGGLVSSLPAAAASTGTRNHLRAGKPPQYFIKPPRPTQPPTLSATANEYWPKCGDVVESKGKHG